MNGKSARRRLAETVIAVAIVLLGTAGTGRTADPDALWKIVHDKCIPDQEQNGSPAPCALVNLREGDAKGYVILKDLVGATQHLLIPTARVSGIESVLLLAPEAPNYFADAWRERSYTEWAAQHALPRQAISLAIDSAFERSQNQLHIYRLCSCRCTSRVAAPALIEKKPTDHGGDTHERGASNQEVSSTRRH